MATAAGLVVGVALVLACAANAALYLLATQVGEAWPFHLRGAHPAGIVIHHSATPTMPSGPDALDLVDDYHASRGWGLYYAGRVYHIGYHYLITADGHVLDGRPPWLPGAHTRGHNDMLGICLIGCFTADQRGRLRRPRPAQMAALERLVRRLAAAYHIPHARVYLHRDLGQTVCPGDGFPREEFFRALWRHG